MAWGWAPHWLSQYPYGVEILFLAVFYPLEVENCVVRVVQPDLFMSLFLFVLLNFI